MNYFLILHHDDTVKYHCFGAHFETLKSMSQSYFLAIKRYTSIEEGQNIMRKHGFIDMKSFNCIFEH